jgi:glycogen phosphorylase
MEYSKNLFPGYHLKAITNSVHPYTWACQPFKELYDAYIPGWPSESELLVRVDEISYQKIWDAHLDKNADRNTIIENMRAGYPYPIETLSIGSLHRSAANRKILSHVKLGLIERL